MESILVAVLSGSVMLLATLVSLWLVDRQHKRHMANYDAVISLLKALNECDMKKDNK